MDKINQNNNIIESPFNTNILDNPFNTNIIENNTNTNILNNIYNQTYTLNKNIDLIHIELINISNEKKRIINILPNIAINTEPYYLIFNQISFLESKQINLILQNYYNLKQICLLIHFNKIECYNIKLFLESYEYYYVLYKFNIYKYDLLNISVEEIKKYIMKDYLFKIITKSYNKKKKIY